MLKSTVEVTKTMLKLAIDVGGTHTDGVLLVHNQDTETFKVLIDVKIPTSNSSITKSVISVIKNVLGKAKAREIEINYADINIHLGTTHFVNALKLRNGLEKVAVIRLALPASDLIPPFFSWPQNDSSLLHAVYGLSAIVHGGCEADGTIISKISPIELENIAEKIKKLKIKRVVLSAPNSPAHPFMELAAQSILKPLLPNDVTISLSQDFQEGGILQRENAAILNASLLRTATQVFAEITSQLKPIGLTLPLLVTRNDGSFMMVEEAIRKPLLAYSSGPINSVRGAGMLSNIKDAIVVDIGGTTTDVGLLKEGTPHMTNLNKKDDGVDIIIGCAHHQSIPLGGGTIIQHNPNGQGIRLAQGLNKNNDRYPLYQGGDLFTLTDLALIKNRLSIREVDNAQVLQQALILNFTDAHFDAADNFFHQLVALAIDETRISHEELPIILCGGGTSLIDHGKLQTALHFRHTGIIIPHNADVANAIGAAGARIRVSLSVTHSAQGKLTKDAIMNVTSEATLKATKMAAACGAKMNSVKCISVTQKPYSYSGNRNIKISIIVEGQLESAVKHQMRLTSTTDASLENSNSFVENYHSLITDKPYKVAYLTRDPITLIVPRMNSSGENNIHDLSENEIEHLAIGAAYLGSGGGGDVNISLLAARSARRNGHQIRMITDINNLNPEDYILVVGYGGMPEVINEKGCSGSSGELAIKGMKQALEEKLNKTINIAAAVPLEIGGANGLLSATHVALCGYPILDMDAMGRAFPTAMMSGPNIFGDFSEHLMVMAKEDESGQSFSITEKTLELCTPKLDAHISRNGGAMFFALMPMTVAAAKKCCVPRTISAAIKIGRSITASLKERMPIVEALNLALTDTIYGGCEEIISGTIIHTNPQADNRFNSGEVTIQARNEAQCKIFYQNENLLAVINNKAVALTPDLITMIDPDSGHAFGSSADYHIGLRVLVVKIGCPRFYLNKNCSDLHPKAKKILRNADIDRLVAEATAPSSPRFYSESKPGGGSAYFQPTASARPSQPPNSDQRLTESSPATKSKK
jgi:N-methylhydantoinase A/oxoprolinase/acetone carboxylase beta subunit/DUF917 family protein